jgi:1-deoxy-D-xylulose-5-phosphate synthase
LSYAHGLSTAFKIAGERRRVVAVIGDGSMTGGMAYEGLNNLGHAQSDVTIVLNDNGRSYAPTVSLLSDSLVRIRSNPVYMARQHRFESFTETLPVVGPAAHAAVRAWKAAVREAFEPKAFFEQLGVRYVGPFDGHDIPALEQALVNSAEFQGPVVLHVLTTKGRGYAPAENDDVKNMHDTSELKPGSYTDAFSKAIVELGEKHDDVVAITAAMPDSTGLLEFRDRFPDRTFDVGIAEQHAVTFAAGLAMGGLRPVVAVYSTFLTRAIDQVNLDVGLHGQPVIFCLDRAGITGDDGPSHHGVLDLVLMSKVPNMTILCPSSYQELTRMLDDAYHLDAGPVCIRWPKTSATHTQPTEVGRGLSARKGRQGDGSVCFIGVGKMFNIAMAAADVLAAEGIDVTVWDPRAARPLDPQMLEDAAGHQLVITAEDGYREGGIGSSIMDEINGRTVVKVLGVPITYLPQAKPDSILASLGLDAEGLAEAARKG